MGAGVRDAFPPPMCVQLYSFAYGNAAVRTFGRAHRRRPYGFVWVDCMWVVDVVWANYARGRLVAFGWIARKCFFRLGRLRVDG